jgi:septal ring factor EnvC (AmiA/AmiB activator)
MRRSIKPFTLGQRIHWGAGLLFAAVIISSTAQADTLDTAKGVAEASNRASAQSQKKIDKMAEQTQSMLEQYRLANRRLQTLQSYNSQLARLIRSQQQEQDSLQQQIEEVEITQREVVPLMLRMVATLERFVELDTPFLPQERSERVAKLKALLDRADVTSAEKFRRVLEAYQVENDYGRTIEAYRGELQQESTARMVDFLRIGRVALFYRSLDGTEVGRWNPETNLWERLTDNYSVAVRDGLRMARKQTAPDLLTLPMPAPEVIQ